MVRCENGLVIAPTRPRARDLVPLDHQRLADMGLGDDEIVDVEVVIVFRIGDRRFQALAHVAGDALAREFEIGERGRDLLAADELRQKVQLLRADPQHAGDRLGLVVGERALALFLAHRYCSQPHDALAAGAAAGADAPHRRLGRRGALGFAIRRMAVERAGRREFTEFVPDHFLGDDHRDVLLAVIDAERQPDELRQDGRTPRPDADHLVTSGRARGIRLFQQITVDKRTLPDRTRHDRSYFCFLRAWRLIMMNFAVDLFLRVFLPLVGLPHGVTGCRPPRVRPPSG